MGGSSATGSRTEITVSRVGNMRKPASSKGLAGSEEEDHPLTLEKRPKMFTFEQNGYLHAGMMQTILGKFQTH